MKVLSLWKGEIEVPVRKPSIASIIAEVAERHGLTPRDLTGPIRIKPITRARQEAMYEAYERTGRSYPLIGRAFNRDHSTVVHGVRAHRERMAEARA